MKHNPTYCIVLIFAALGAARGQTGEKPCPVKDEAINSTDQGVPMVLACEWLGAQGESKGQQKALAALGLLTDSSTDVPKNFDGAFDLLREGAPGFDDLFNAVQGSAFNAVQGNARGDRQPFGQGYTAILKALAEANTRKNPPDGTTKLSDSAYKSRLIDDATVAIKLIYKKHKTEIGRVNALFVGSNPNRALYELLKAYPECPVLVAGGTPEQIAADTKCRADYVKALENIRAAYQASADDLAKAVANLVHGPAASK
jgi:hypothetical protein